MFLTTMSGYCLKTKVLVDQKKQENKKIAIKYSKEKTF